MKKSFYFWSIALLFLLCTAFASALVIYSVMPNTDDDANQEYIDLYNSSCDSIDLTWVSLQDASGKKYTFTGGILESGDHRKVWRTESKITLNNTDEIVQIFDKNGIELHKISYSTSEKNLAIDWIVSPPNCQVVIIEETTTETLPTEVITDIEGESEASEPVIPPIEIFSESWAISGIPSNIGSGSSILLETEGITDSWSVVGSVSNSQSGILIIPETTITSIAPGILIQSENTNIIVGNSWWTIFEVPTLSGAVNSGATVLPNLDTTILTPLQLFLYDIDANKKIDRLVVQYSGTLSWVLLQDKFILFSASGWLADHLIDTGSGVVKNLSYSGSELVIEIFEQNLFHLDLSINNTTTSGIRLKTLSGFWLTNVSGIPVLPITFTQSFDGYNKQYIKNMSLPPVLPASNSPISNQVVESSPLATRVLPEPTILFQSGITSQGYCGGKTCRINFIHPVQEKFEMCRWHIVPWLGNPSILDGCNPKVITLGGSGGTISLTLLDSVGVLPYKSNMFSVWSYQSLAQSPGTTMTKIAVPKLSESATSIKKQTGSATSKTTPTTPKITPKKATSKVVAKKVTPLKKTVATKVTTTKTTQSKAASIPKEPKATLAPLAQKSQTPSDSVTIGIIGIACAGIGFCIALLRRRDPEPKG